MCERVFIAASIRPGIASLCLLLGAALGCGGGASSSQTPPKGQSPSITLTAQPDTIASGSSSVLRWSASNTTSVTLKGLGTFGASGSVTVSPTATTTYTATATGPGGTAFASTTVTITTAPPPPPPPVVPVFSHVFVVVEENHGYSSVIGSSSMPYLNSLASQYSLATQYYANTHPSIGNYFMMTTGQIVTNNDSYNTTVTADNIVRQFLTAGKTWKSYAESLPSVGYTGWDVYPYVKHHNPFAYFSDVVNSSNQKNYLVPFSQFATDMKNNQLPQFSFIIPNQKNNAHDGTLNQADAWLKTNIAPLISNSAFSQNGMLIILFDEADSADSNHGGGHIATLIISPKAKKAYKSTTLYQHQSALRLMLQGLGVTSYPGAAGSATSMTEFF